MNSLCDDNTVAVVGSRQSPREAFEIIVKKHMKDAYFIALGLVGNREDALELSQEAFYRAYRHYDQLKEKGKFFPWFYQILRNLCFSHLRKRKVRRAGSLDDADGTPGEPTVADCFDPGMVAERNEAKDRVWKAISRLDEGYTVRDLFEPGKLLHLLRADGTRSQVLFKGLPLRLIQLVVQISHHQVLMVLAGHCG